MQQLLSTFPVRLLLRVLPCSLVLLLQLAAATALAIPSLSLSQRIVSFCLAHGDEYIRAAAAAADSKLLQPLKQNVQRALDAARQRTQ